MCNKTVIIYINQWLYHNKKIFKEMKNLETEVQGFSFNQTVNYTVGYKNRLFLLVRCDFPVRKFYRLAEQ